MDVNPQLLREVEFREQRRGYDQKEVDDFLEEAAVAVGQLRERLDEALERATRAERRVLEGPADEDELRRTLVLASRTAEATREEAERSAAVTMRDAEDRAAALIRDAQARAASVVADAERRVQDQLEPLLAQREAIERDVEALQGWAAQIRGRLTDQVRQQLAWLEGPEAELPPRPELVRVELPEGPPAGDPVEGMVAVPAEPEVGEGGGPYGVADGWDPTPPDVRVGERPPDGDGTAASDTVAAGGAGGPSPETADDPFLAELRRAVDDDEPLGPRDSDVGVAGPGAEPGSVAASAGGADAGEDGGPTSLFRRRRPR